MKWTDELIKSELLKSIEILGLKRMPTGEELKGIGRNDLHCKLSRTKKYSGWANELGLELKSSCTILGRTHEKEIAELLKIKGFEVEEMTTKHPYDLLVDKVVKIDVKVANPYLMRGTRVHTFNLSKEKPTCDIYILIVLNEQGHKERILTIPSHHIQQKSISIGLNSQYNKYDDFYLIDRYSDFLNSI